MNGPCHRPILPRGNVAVIYGAGGGGDRQPQPQAPAAPLVPGVSSEDTGPVPAGAVGTVGAASSSLEVLGAEIPKWGEINPISGGAKKGAQGSVPAEPRQRLLWGLL